MLVESLIAISCMKWRMPTMRITHYIRRFSSIIRSVEGRREEVLKWRERWTYFRALFRCDCHARCFDAICLVNILSGGIRLLSPKPRHPNFSLKPRILTSSCGRSFYNNIEIRNQFIAHLFEYLPQNLLEKHKKPCQWFDFPSIMTFQHENHCPGNTLANHFIQRVIHYQYIPGL